MSKLGVAYKPKDAKTLCSRKTLKKTAVPRKRRPKNQ